MKKILTRKKFKITFVLTTILVVIGTILALCLCLPLNKSSVNYESNLANKTIKNSNYSFQQNAHNNVDLSKMAACIDANEIQYMYDILNNPIMANFMTWLSSQKILVVDGQIPNPKWGRVPTNNPGTYQQQISSIQQNFVLLTPQLYPILYTSPKNIEAPGFGMQFPIPNNYQQMLKDYKGEIIAGKTGQNKQQALFEAMKNSADIVIYVYPGTSTWIKNNISIAQNALKPLLTSQSKPFYKDTIIPLELSQGFDSINSPIGLVYLFQSLLNGEVYTQTYNGSWFISNQTWPSSFKKIYLDFNPQENNNRNFINYINAVTPYFEILNNYGIDFQEDKYATNNKNVIFPFAEKYLHTLKNPNSNQRTLSAYFNATSMLISLGFTPYYSTYIIDPHTTNIKSLENGVAVPDYIKNIYPNIINSSQKQQDGKIILVKQTTTGIWEHHVDPININLVMLRVGTIFVDDWLMPETPSLYNNGQPLVNHIIYNTQGDYTLNGEVFFTSNNKAANFNTTELNPSVSNVAGFFPQNLLEIPNFYKTFLGNDNYSSTGIPGQLGNSVFDIFTGFQWFANQIQFIKNNEFQIPTISYKFIENNTLKEPFYDWNTTNKDLKNEN